MTALKVGASMSSVTPIDASPLTDLAQCKAYMLERVKPPEEWVIGTEHEKIGWWPEKGTYPTFEGPHGIGALLEDMAATGEWEVVREGADIIALGRDRATITLEPGGQLELSGAPLRTLDEAADELDAHLADVRRFSARHGIEWSSLGIAPAKTPPEMPRMPKARYGIMRRYLPTQGRYALHMMHQTCTVQANYDFSDEVDAMRKLRASLHLQPFVTAAFANSRVVNGVRGEAPSFRGIVWEETDPARTLFPEALLREGARLDDYVEWSTGIPLFFIHRDGGYIDCAGLPFETFLREGFQGHAATMGDFALHLSTLFPDARIKQHFEVRGADMGDRDYLMALPAFHAGVLYDAQALDETLALFDGVGLEAHRGLRAAACRQGLKARLRGVSLAELGAELLRIAHAGLERWQPGSARYLRVLEEAVPAGRCPADALDDWDGDVAALLARNRIA